VPFRPFNLGFEDSASLMAYTQELSKAIIKVAVIKLPYISNFTDFEPLIVDAEVELFFITSPSEMHSSDLVILPGSKRVIDDLLWLKERGFEKPLKDKNTKVVAICGGYEMMFEKILDPFGVESKEREVEGFGRFKGEVVFQKEKIVKKGCYNLFGVMGDAYEIHNGTTKKKAKLKKNIHGTFLHGIFASDDFRDLLFSEINPNYKGYNFKEFKAKSIANFAEHIDKHIDMQRVLDALNE